MRVLLDECLPRELTRALTGFDPKTARQMNWLGIKNGRLLKLIGDSRNFDVFVTVDKNLPYQQNLTGISFAIVVLRLKSNRVNDVLAHAPELLRRLPNLKPGDVVELSPSAIADA